MRVRMVTTTMSEGKVLLGVRGVSKSFFQVEVPAGIDLQIHRGELLVLSGPNGAGKTRVACGCNRTRSGKGTAMQC